MEKLSLTALRKKIRQFASPQKKVTLKRFFKCGPGQYGEGDQFLGVSVPSLRQLIPFCVNFRLPELNLLLHSRIHEERLLALLVLVDQFGRAGDSKQQKLIADFYLSHRKAINNWDLVDLSAHKILGAYLEEKPKDILFKLANSKVLWDRRIAMVATWHFIRIGKLELTFDLAQKLMQDPEDLMHKACGWMLREAGKKDEKRLECFLNQYAGQMPRTMLRYAIEKFSAEKRTKYLKA